MSDTNRTLQLIDYYRNERVENQRQFYRRNAESFKKKDRALRIGAGALVLGNGLVSTVTAALATSREPNFGVTLAFGISLALLPAISTALLTLRRVYQFESTEHLYRQTFLKLGQQLNDLDALTERHAADPDGVNLDEEFEAYIKRVESVIANESVQWYARASEVQPASAPAATGSPYTAKDPTD